MTIKYKKLKFHIIPEKKIIFDFSVQRTLREILDKVLRLKS